MYRKNRFLLSLGICVLAGFAQSAFAFSESQNNQVNGTGTPLFIPAVYSIEGAWNTQDHDFTAPQNITISSNQTINSSTGDDVFGQQKEKLNLKAEPKSKDKHKEWVDEIVAKLPYKNTLRYSVNYMKGDIDVMDVKNLRVDAGNRGLTYKTNYVPLMGNVEGAEIQADLGKDTELSFESDYMPLVGRVDGFRFKASAGDGASVSVRYKTAIDW